jgi:AraC family transcriptional regulator, positive regulator of tynA and feaB
MRILFSTSDVHQRDRFDYWHDVACKNIVNHDSEPDCRQNFHAELWSRGLANINLILFENSPMTVRHTARQTTHLNADELFVCHQIAGAVAMEQDGREILLETDDVTLIDPRRPYFAKFFEGTKMLVLRIPRRSLEARVGSTRLLTACSIKPSGPEGMLAAAFLAMLPNHVAGLSPATEEIVENQALDLIAVSLAMGTAGRTPRVSSARSIILMKVRTAIDARLTDPALDCETVAAAAGVSRRYVNAVLAEERTSITHFIQSRRLERCRIALEDPLQTHRTVSEIAYGWGFCDMTHFGRKFRATYGVSPREYRKKARVA